MTIKFRREANAQQLGGDVVFSGQRRWVRFAAYYGTPPGSYIGFWRTRVDDFRGLNLRLGRRFSGPCLTMFVHTRPALWRP